MLVVFDESCIVCVDGCGDCGFCFDCCCCCLVWFVGCGGFVLD